MTDSSDDSKQGGGKKRPPRQRKPVQGNPDADPVNVHRDYVERRMWSGDEAEPPVETDSETTGRPATPDRYARAAEQWHRLPGAVRTPATEVGRGDPASDTSDTDTSDTDTSDTDTSDTDTSDAGTSDTGTGDNPIDEGPS